MVVALVTGGNSGIGEAVGHQLATQLDHHIVIAARNPEAGAKVAADLVAARALSIFSSIGPYLR